MEKELKIKYLQSLPINSKLTCKFEDEKWIIGYLVRSSIYEYSLVDESHVTRHRFKHLQIPTLIDNLFVLIDAHVKLPKGLSIVNREDVKTSRELASFRISRQGSVMKNRIYANEIKVPIEVGDIVAMKKTKKEKIKMASSHEYLVVIEKRSLGNGTNSIFKIGNSNVGIVKNWITEHELHFVSHDRKLVGEDLDLFFKSVGNEKQLPASKVKKLTKQKSSMKKMVRRCNCSVGDCSNNRCWCFRNGYSCSSKCHPGKTDCQNCHETVFERILAIKNNPQMDKKMKKWQFPHKYECFNAYDNINFGLMVPRIVMRVKEEKEIMPMLLNLASQYMLQSEGKLLYGKGFIDQSIEMITKMFNEKVMEYDNSPFSISMRYGNCLRNNDVKDIVDKMDSNAHTSVSTIFLTRCIINVIYSDGKYWIVDPGINGKNQPISMFVSRNKATIASLISIYGLLDSSPGDHQKSLREVESCESFELFELKGNQIPKNPYFMLVLSWSHTLHQSEIISI